MRHINTPERRRHAAYWAQVLRNNAEAWWVTQGRAVPPADNPEYVTMYDAWTDYMRFGR